jgi:hypothetical protein
LAIALLLGCGSSDDAADGGFSGDGDAADGPGDSATGGTGIDVSTASASADGGDLKLDVAAMPTGGGGDDGGTAEGCRKVDVIFAVDNSGSMGEEHDALRGPVFDTFPAALLSINNGIDDFQLAVIDACPKPALFHNYGASGACEFSIGDNYMVSSEPSLPDEFSCVTDFADNGYNDEPDACIDDDEFNDDDEQPGLAAAESVSAENLGGANAGFLRGDALLFIVTITDEDEALVDVDSTQEIYDRILSAKNGDVNKIVYLGIAGGSDCDGEYGSADDATQAQELTAMFEAQGRGMFWDLCQGDLQTAFQTAIENIVDSACQDFVPEG